MRPSWVHSLPFRPQLSRSADHLRRQVGRFDDPDVRKARRLARASRSDAIDVLFFSDSTASFVAPRDSDIRPLHQMLADLLGDEVATHAVHGGSYGPPLFDAFLRVVTVTRGRPLVIVPLCVRLRTTPWIEHPVHGRKRAVEFLSGIDTAAPLWKLRAGFPPPSSADFSAFHRLPHPTWAGDLTVGDYVGRLKQPTSRDEGWVKLLYAYHHGGSVQQGPGLHAVTRLGEHLCRLGADVVAYQTPVPVEKGVELHGEDFRALAERNFAMLEEAFLAGVGRKVPVLPTGLAVPTQYFIDWRDGTEHLNEQGRHWLAGEIGAAAKALLKRSARDPAY